MISGNDFKTFQYNILGAGTHLTGDISLSGDTILTARIEGNITMLSPSKLVLERGSEVEGRIEAFDLEVFGSIKGDIISNGSVSIRSSAQISGSIKAKKLIIYPGAIVDTKAITQE
ncbi:MAG: polymer-forming cytoskeletal protein [Bacteriovoracaceae bacterium]